jgi:hypothetical protein
LGLKECGRGVGVELVRHGLLMSRNGGGERSGQPGHTGCTGNLMPMSWHDELLVSVEALGLFLLLLSTHYVSFYRFGFT